jgi:hypothetical protein
VSPIQITTKENAVTIGTQLSFDLDQIEKVAGAGDTAQKLTTMLYFIPAELLKECTDEKQADKNRDAWRGLVDLGIQLYHKKFELPAKVIIHAGVIPEKWRELFPNVVFRPDRALTAGHYVFCFDPEQFEGKAFISVTI